MNLCKVILNILIINIIIPSTCFAFTETPHRDINTFSVNAKDIIGYDFDLNNYLINNLGMQMGNAEPTSTYFSFQTFSVRKISASQWIINGCSSEDFTPRYFSHFHNGIDNNGFKNIFDSAVIWAQLPIGKQKYSWNDARYYYYNALIGSSAEQRNKDYTLAFRSIGQVMHLVADMAIPEHTRNDAHPFPPGIESYVKRRLQNTPGYITDSIATPFFFDFKTLQTTPSAFANAGAPIPIANLFDTNSYTGNNPDTTIANTAGLAEYSNANFLSTDTNPVSKDILIPPFLAKTTSAEADIPDPLRPGETIKRKYHVKSQDGETAGGTGYKLSAMTVLYSYAEDLGEGANVPEEVPLLDDNVYADYASLLLPRAAGYAATALHYFFRGQLELSLPARGRYAIATPDSGGFDNIRIKARDITANNEALSSGTVELVVKYKTALDDPFQGVPVPVSADFSYIVVPEANGVSTIPTDSPIELVFNLGGQTIPLNATDLTVQVVYHGQMGFQTPTGFAGETNGVAVGLKDISEPTPIDYINSMDVVCINDQILPAGSDEAVNTLDASGKSIATYVDVYPHSLANGYLKHSPQNQISYASATNYDATIATLPPGHYARYFVLTEPYGTRTLVNGQNKPVRLDSRDSFTHWTQAATNSMQGIINQEVYIDGIRTRYFSSMTDIRGIKAWAGIQWTNMDYPSTSTCNESVSDIPLTGPDVINLQQ